MVDLPPPPPAPAARFGLGLILGIIISLTTGEGRVEEIFLGTGGGLIGGALYTLGRGTSERAQFPGRCRPRRVRRPEGPVVVADRGIPQRHWRSYGTDPLPTAAEAPTAPFGAFPWFLRFACDRCGKARMVNEGT